MSTLLVLTEEYWNANRSSITEANLLDKCRELHKIIDEKFPGTSTAMRGRHGKATTALAQHFQNRHFTAPTAKVGCGPCVTSAVPAVPPTKPHIVPTALKPVALTPAPAAPVQATSKAAELITCLFFRPATQDKGFYELVLLVPPGSSKYTGPHGPVIEGETPVEAAVHITLEATGCQTRNADWREFCVLEKGTEKHRYFVNHSGAGQKLKHKEGIASWFSLSATHEPTTGPQLLPDLYWLIPLALHQANPSYHFTDKPRS